MRLEFTLLEMSTALVSGLVVAGLVTASSRAPFPADAAIFLGTGLATFFGLLAAIAWLKNDWRR